MRKNDLFSLSGEAYDISAACIKTRADQDGAKVFEIEGRIGKLRVLDFSEAEAERTYKEEASDVLDCPQCKRPDADCFCCPNCGSKSCECDEDDED